jgi:hypothetical protein
MTSNRHALKMISVMRAWLVLRLTAIERTKTLKIERVYAYWTFRIGHLWLARSTRQLLTGIASGSKRG